MHRASLTERLAGFVLVVIVSAFALRGVRAAAAGAAAAHPPGGAVRLWRTVTFFRSRW